MVTRTLSLDKVRKELNEWRAPIKDEYESLLRHQAIEPINREQYLELQKTHEIEVIPASLWQQSSHLSKEKLDLWHVSTRPQRMKMLKLLLVAFAR